MRHLLLFGIALSFLSTLSAQSTIIFDKTISSKYEKIVAALPGLVKAFGTKPHKLTGGSSTTYYTSTITPGSAAVTLSEDERQQVLSISYTNSYIKGTENDYLAFFTLLVNKITELTNTTHLVKLSSDSKNKKQYDYIEKGKTAVTSVYSVFIEYTTFTPNDPVIMVSFYVNK
jgi:hypothetical protein